MKKIINIKEITIILVSLLVITFSTNVFATGLVLGNENAPISANEYENAQKPEVENTNTNTNTNINANANTNTNINTNTNKNTNTKVYNTNNNSKDLPQTGIEDYNIGILLIICVSSAIFAYKKVSDYKNI